MKILVKTGSWQVHAAEASGQIGISNADELKKIGKDKDYPMDGGLCAHR